MDPSHQACEGAGRSLGEVQLECHSAREGSETQVPDPPPPLMEIFRYDALTQEWIVDDCFVKIHNKPFANGAMRECFRM